MQYLDRSIFRFKTYYLPGANYPSGNSSQTDNTSLNTAILLPGYLCTKDKSRLSTRLFNHDMRTSLPDNIHACDILNSFKTGTCVLSV